MLPMNRSFSPACRPTWQSLAASMIAALMFCLPVRSSVAAATGDLLVASFSQGSITRVDGVTGSTIYSVPLGTSAINLAEGPNGAIYVSTLFTSSVSQFDAETGTPIGVFASGGGLTTAVGVTFGPDGALYVGSRSTNSVIRYDGTTGAFLNTFIGPGSGGLFAPEALLFGPDGNLYVTEFSGNRVLRFEGQTGAFIDVFASSPSLNGARGIAFGPTGDLYVAGNFSNNVVRFNGQTGAFINVFASSVPGANGLVFGPDGRLYVAAEGADLIVRLDATTGAKIDDFAFVVGPIGLLFVDTFNARQTKRDAVADLTSILKPSNEKRVSAAIKHLEDSLRPELWIDDTHLSVAGKRVFDGERKAVQDLEKLKEENATIASVVQTLVFVDATLASIAIEEAAADASLDLEAAYRHFDRAKTFEEQGKPQQAIQAYRAAWIAVQHAVRNTTD